MESFSITSTFEVYEALKELPGEVQSLMDKAIASRKTAYAPYSKFQVGAAILLENNKIVTGSNQENASYPSGLCAERTAIYSAGATYPKVKMLKMALSASSQNFKVLKPVPPCGACRQAIAEYEILQKQPIEIYFMGEEGKVVKVNSLKDLLPLGFDNSFL